MRTEEKLYTVYRLKNVVTGKNYIGMTSQNPKERWGKGYKGKMNEAIQKFPLDLCWKKYIEFQTTNKEQALELEAELMKWYDSVDNGYNSSEYGSSHYKHPTLSEETKKKISDSMTGEKHPLFGMTGEKAYWYGKHHSEETRKKLSDSKPKKPVLQFSKNGEFIAEYPSTQEAGRQTGCNQGNICECCKGKRKSCGGFIWQYKSSY